MLVFNANTHLLNMLQYQAQAQPHVSESSLISFPRVTLDFVKSNGLESAVDAGVLNVAGIGSSIKVSPNNVAIKPSDTFLPYVVLLNRSVCTLRFYSARRPMVVRL